MTSTPARHPTTTPHRDASRRSVPSSSLDPDIAARLKRSADGLVPAIAQQYDTGEVLMLGWMDDEALHRTLTTGRCTYWSRSRQEYWVKGDTSGHFQHVKSVALDCDADTVLVKVDQVGAACHTGARTCFDADVLLKEDLKENLREDLNAGLLEEGADSSTPASDQ
jgi:phosphoribosyl-AMP cyclohydrolase